ncbi:class I SAM-dependent methyltransferase [Sphingobacterium sp. T2]|uniref:class I SAM-dependent methyltransferase n=1 Tax=Sphingobacterium sp. T2 TaxID=1590596 RepID=UPI00068CF642|nr:class I SAM-dependent methyltransferase [Sphingobacterium sp. T2]
MSNNEASTLKPYKSKDGGKKEQVADMFNNISKRYDLLNRLMTMRIDVIWRKKAIRLLQSIKPQYILDVATGTGDFAIESIQILKPKKVVGVDISQGMLDIAKEKIQKRVAGSNLKCSLAIPKICSLPTAVLMQ